MAHRVVITGMGLVSPLGGDAETSFRALVEARSGIGPLPDELARHSDIRVGGIVDDFDASAVVGKKNVKRTSRFVQLALAASRQARQDAQLEQADYAPERVGTLLGSALGGLDLAVAAVEDFRDGGPRRVSPFTLPASITNMAAGLIAIETGAKGTCFCMTSGWASAGHAIGQSYERVRRGAADAMITGGTEAAFHAYVLAMLSRTGDFSTARPTGSNPSRPFDRRHSGLVLSEGAAVLVLETLEAARRRGAPIYAEIAGYGCTYALPEDRVAGRTDRAMSKAMTRALQTAELCPQDVDYVNAYGSSVPESDRAETAALKRVFGDNAPWVSSNKGAAGHLLGASAAFEAVATALTLRHGVVPPTANLEEADEACDLDYLPGDARERLVETALSNTFSETGHNVSLVLKRCEDVRRAT